MSKYFFEQVKNRKIWHSMVAYPAAAFLILQAIDFFISKYGWNHRLLTFSLILLIGGFPIALLWNWKHGPTEQQSITRTELSTYGNISLITIATAILFWVFGGVGSPNNNTSVNAENTTNYLIKLDNPIRNDVKRYHLNLPEDKAMYQDHRTTIAISPNGKQIVYVGYDGNETKLYRRAIDKFDVYEIEGTEGALGVFFAPDNQWVGFITKGEIKKIKLDGKKPTTLCLVSYVWGASWGPQDLIVFGNDDGNNLSYVSASGGEIHTLNEQGYLPYFLPDGIHVLANNLRNIYVVNIETGIKTNLNIKGIPQPVGNSVYLKSGHIVIAQSGSLYAVPFDINTLKVLGPTVPMLTNLRTERVREAGQFACSENGTLIYASGGSVTEAYLIWLDKQGKSTRLPFEARKFGDLKLSPDNNYLAAHVYGVESNLYLYNLVNNHFTPLLEDLEIYNPVWSPDSKSIGFCIYFKGTRKPGMYLKYLNSKQLDTLSNYTCNYPISFTPSGKQIIYLDTLGVLRLFDLKKKQTNPEPFIDDSNPWTLTFAPNGKYMAYTARSKGTGYDVFVRTYPPTEQRWKISVNSGEVPLWSPDGKKIYYRDVGIRGIYEVDVSYNPEISFSKPRLLMERPSTDVPGTEWALSKDGSYFLSLEPVQQEVTTNTLYVIDGWFIELQNFVRAKK